MAILVCIFVLIGKAHANVVSITTVKDEPLLHISTLAWNERMGDPNPQFVSANWEWTIKRNLTGFLTSVKHIAAPHGEFTPNSIVNFQVSGIFGDNTTVLPEPDLFFRKKKFKSHGAPGNSLFRHIPAFPGAPMDADVLLVSITSGSPAAGSLRDSNKSQKRGSSRLAGNRS